MEQSGCESGVRWHERFTALAVLAKNVMASVPQYLEVQTAFTAVRWLMVGPQTALAFRAGSAS